MWGWGVWDGPKGRYVIFEWFLTNPQLKID